LSLFPLLEVLLAFPPDSDFELPVYQGNSPVLLVFYLSLSSFMAGLPRKQFTH